MKESYGTLSETINGLKKEGYNIDFNTNKEHLINYEGDMILSPDDFEIEKAFRFEGETNPDDESVLYAISSPTFGTKGLLVNGYGISADVKANKLISKLKTHPIKKNNGK